MKLKSTAINCESITKSLKNWDPSFYDQNCILQFQTSVNLLNSLSLTGNEKILDIGCGTGKITFHLSKRIPNGKIVGLDICKDMIVFAQKNYVAGNLSFIEQDIQKMNFQEQFDVIVSFWALSWIKNQNLALTNIFNALKSSGRLLLMYPMRHDAYDVAEVLIQEPKWQSHFPNYSSPRPFVSESEYRTILNSFKNADITAHSRELPCQFSSLEEMKFSIRSWMAFLDVLPIEQLKIEFLDDFVNAYMTHRNCRDYVMYFSILEIRAVKNIL